MTAEASSVARTRAPIASLLAANAISKTGNVASLVAIPWFVLQTTGSPSRTGITAFAGLLPVVLSGIFGGALVDRVGNRRMSVVADLASAVAVGAIPLLHATVGLAFWQLVALVFVGGLLDAPGATARAALLPDVARNAGWSLERASGAAAVVERGSRLAGAPLAGVLVALVDPTQVLWIDAATFVASAVIVVVGVPVARAATRAVRTSYVRELRDGFDFLRRDRTLATLVAVVTFTNLLDSVAMVVLPVLAQRLYGSAVSLGLMMGALGAGLVLGALVFTAFGDRAPRRLVFCGGFLGVSVWYPVAAAFPPLAWLIATLAFAGACSGPLNPIMSTVLFERVPGGFRGRVLGVTQAAAWLAMPLGVLLAGPIVESAGLRATLLASGALYVAVVVGAALLPALRSVERAAKQTSPGRATC